MRVDEIKAWAASLTEEERVWLSAYLMHLDRVDSEVNKADLSARNRSIEDGNSVTLDQAKRVHRALLAEGL